MRPDKAAHLRRVQREPRRRDDRRHLDEELNHVDDEHAPEAGVRREDDVQDADEEQRLPALEAEQDPGDLAGRQVHGGHDHAVEQQAEVDGAEAAHQACRPPRVADLVELEIRHHPRAAPEPRVEEHRGDARQHKRPPHPVAGHAIAPDDVGDQVGGVAAEGGCDHRQPGEPPRHGPAGREELRGALPRPPAEEQRRDKADQQADAGDNPVDELEVHRRTLQQERTAAHSRTGPEGRRGLTPSSLTCGRQEGSRPPRDTVSSSRAGCGRRDGGSAGRDEGALNVYSRHHLALTPGTRLGPYEVTARSAKAEWARSTARATAS